MTQSRTFQMAAGAISWFALIVQFIVLMKMHNGTTVEGKIITFFSFMTIWTNLLIAVYYTSLTLFPSSKISAFFSSTSVSTGILLYILVVMIAYHFLLAHIWNPVGWQKVADKLLHYVVPVLFLVQWVLFVSKKKMALVSCIRWLIYPLVYLLFALVYGFIAHRYPYPFLDVSQLGYAEVLRNSLFLAIGYFVFGFLLVVVTNVLARREISPAEKAN